MPEEGYRIKMFSLEQYPQVSFPNGPQSSPMDKNYYWKYCLWKHGKRIDNVYKLGTWYMVAWDQELKQLENLAPKFSYLNAFPEEVVQGFTI